MNPTRSPRHRVAILGAGFGGMAAARSLSRLPVDVTLVDQHDYQTFQPLLYQVATAVLPAENAAHPLRSLLRGAKNVGVRRGRVERFELDDRRLRLDGGGTIEYDTLVVAAGSTYGDFGVPGVSHHAFVLQSLLGAVGIRNHVLRQFESAALDPAGADDGRLDIVIAGAGPTGVEMAGSLQELFSVLRRDHPQLADVTARIVMVEPAGSVLPQYGPRARRYAERELRRRGVELRLGTGVARAEADHVELTDGTCIATRTLVWAAGVRASALGEQLGAPLGRGRRVAVTENLHLESRPEVFVIGDMADAPGPLPHPQVAQVASQMGAHVGRVLRARLSGANAPPWRYHDKGQMAVIGRGAGVVELSRRYGGLRFGGFMGWLAWLFVHLVYLPGPLNRLAALSAWLHDAFKRERSARLILERGSPELGRGSRWSDPASPVSDGSGRHDPTGEDLRRAA